MALKRRKPMRRRAAKPAKKVRKVKKEVYTPPAWFKKVKPGAHGNNLAQKKFWRVISCFVRQRDQRKYGKCVSCPTKCKRWQDYDAAHFKRYSVCNSYFKFNPHNIAASCKNCNRNDDGVVGHNFGEELIRRYGPQHLEWIEEENLRQRGKKLETHKIVEIIEELLADNSWFNIETTFR